MEGSGRWVLLEGVVEARARPHSALARAAVVCAGAARGQGAHGRRPGLSLFRAIRLIYDPGSTAASPDHVGEYASRRALRYRYR